MYYNNFSPLFSNCKPLRYLCLLFQWEKKNKWNDLFVIKSINHLQIFSTLLIQQGSYIPFQLKIHLALQHSLIFVFQKSEYWLFFSDPSFFLSPLLKTLSLVQFYPYWNLSHMPLSFQQCDFRTSPLKRVCLLLSTEK
jgi:hypothetical protein